MEMPITTEYFLSEAYRIIEESAKRGIVFRILGSLAFRIHCTKYSFLLDDMKRELTDVDFMGSSNHRHLFKSFMADMGYGIDKDLLVATEGERFFFKDLKTGLGIDIFVDKLDFCHTIWMKGRLELDKPTIPLADMLMEKMQIVEINMKDLKDVFVHLLEHEFGNDSREKIDLQYLCGILSDDWGFYQTFTMNLHKCKTFLMEFTTLSVKQQAEIIHKIDTLLSAIENRPKSLRWKIRAKIGTKVKWYRDVSAKEDTF